MLETKISILEQDSFSHYCRGLIETDVDSLFDEISKDYNASIKLSKVIDNERTSYQILHLIFRRLLHVNMPDHLVSLVAKPNFHSMLSANISDEDSDMLLKYIEANKIRLAPSLFQFFGLNDKISAYLENTLYDLIVERNTNPNAAIPLTIGSWAVYGIIRAYKDANLGKAVVALKRIIAPTILGAVMDQFVKEFPKAEKYVSII